MTQKETFIRSLFEGADWTELYKRNSDPLFPTADAERDGKALPLFHGRIPLSFWLKVPFPLPSIKLTFCGNPVTDIFPCSAEPLKPGEGREMVKAALKSSSKHRPLAMVVKDLPAGDPLEGPLSDEGFVPVEHDPIWYTQVSSSLDEFLHRLSKGRRRGLEGRWRRFNKLVTVRPGTIGDADFIKKSYDNVWMRSEMRLERLTKEFFRAGLEHPSCSFLIFEKDTRPFAFIMLWQKDDMWFDKYMGTDEEVYREVSFYSMSILHILEAAARKGIRLYVAGQGSGKDKEGLGFQQINVRLWIKPLFLGFMLSPLLKRFMNVHKKRVFDVGAEASEPVKGNG